MSIKQALYRLHRSNEALRRTVLRRRRWEARELADILRAAEPQASAQCLICGACVPNSSAARCPKCVPAWHKDPPAKEGYIGREKLSFGGVRRLKAHI